MIMCALVVLPDSNDRNHNPVIGGTYVSGKKKGDTVKYLLLISVVIRILFYAEFVAGSL